MYHRQRSEFIEFKTIRMEKDLKGNVANRISTSKKWGFESDCKGKMKGGKGWSISGVDRDP